MPALRAKGRSSTKSTGRRDEAIEGYKQILDVDANHVVALNNLAYGLAVHRNMPAEGAALRPSRGRSGTDDSDDSRHAGMDSSPAWRRRERSQGDGAGDQDDNVLNPDIRLHAAVIFAAVGKRAVAQNQLAIALKLNPSTGDAPRSQGTAGDSSRNRRSEPSRDHPHAIGAGGDAAGRPVLRTFGRPSPFIGQLEAEPFCLEQVGDLALRPNRIDRPAHLELVGSLGQLLDR